MTFAERLNNVYVIDTNMFGFDHYNSAFLVVGKEIALIDTGLPSQLEAVRNNIKTHGFSVSDITYIFVTHCEHTDHAGNVAPLLRESPRAFVYIHPIGREYLIDPSIELARRRARMPEMMSAAEKDMEAVPAERIKYVNDGDVFDLGNGERLEVIFAPGHQPSGIVLYEEKNKGLFINDLVGNYFADAGAQYPLNPVGSDHKKGIASLKKLLNLPLDYLYLGHYGICDNPKQVIGQAITNNQQLLDMGMKCIKEGKSEAIADKMYQMILPEIEKLRRARGEAIYQYAGQSHIPFQAKMFAKYCQENLE